MPHLLHLDSSADLTTSRSRAVTAAFAEAWRSRGDDFTVTHRDLHRDPLPHFATNEQHWPAADRRPDAQVPADQDALTEQIHAELLAADVLVVGAPLYNYTVPSTLKVWLDHVHIPGALAGEGSQPLKGRPAVVVSARGATYDAGTPTESWDHGVPVLQIILGNSLGMQVHVVQTSATLADRLPDLADLKERADAELEAAQAAARELALTL
ncbi:FMN-dependent NADH-azoreductase [Kineococcus rhizosphaerae]|uniref:FMN dependent NADH:quinone oxidoreductase n=1 Tax=Kineococcus rhizosphaerae TaxID=559628 RepID=A0A2T0R2P5_9ACTN|nr:NAD(P)H-dependent oxidoreductase [Kineococcus rhizosphaerae]PRY14087.1 FMN-dependent NADH-azoreductase [Kineococcus rhizosphaerae]